MRKLLGVAGEKPNRYFHLPKSMKSALFGHSYPTAVAVRDGESFFQRCVNYYLGELLAKAEEPG
jgi:hypothetical protein